MISYYNGRYLPQESILISGESPAFQYGLGVFTSLRTKQGKAILLTQHLNRLNENAKKLGLTLPSADYEEIIQELVRLNKSEKLRLKIILFEDTNKKTGLLIMTSQFQANNTPRKLTVISDNYQPSMFRNIKSLNYMENVILHREAIRNGFDDGLLVNSRELICECCYANIFFVKECIIYTPKANGNILNGIIRQELMKEFPIIEKDILLSELASFEQVFTSNSVQGISFVKEIAGYCYNSQAIPELEKWATKLGFL